MAANPVMDLPPAAPQLIWRSGDKLVMHRSAVLPDRCVKTNLPAEVRLKRTLSWAHPALVLLVLFGFIGLLLWLILSASLQRKAQVEIPLTQRVVKKWRSELSLLWLLTLLLVLFIVLSFWQPGFLVAVLGMLVVILFGLASTRLVVVTDIDTNGWIWLRGVHSDFLQQYPEWLGFNRPTV
jgi:hypothetical protein